MSNTGIICYKLPNDKQVEALLLSSIPTDAERVVFHPFDIKNNPTLELYCIEKSKDKEEILNWISTCNLSDLDPLDFNAKSEQRYLRMVQDTVDYLKNDPTEKIVLSRGLLYQKRMDNPYDVFEKLCADHPAAFVYLFHHPEAGMWMGATPELLLSAKNQVFKTMSLAGTRSKLRPVEWSSKELEEQEIVTKAIIEVLRVHGVQNIEIDGPYDQVAGNVVHLRTDIQGTIDQKTQVYELAQALHPTPATCGQPKEAALEYIRQHEGYDRAYYTGFIGIEKENITQYFVNLRCMQVFKQHIVAYAGGGITQYSIPEAEWNETINKLQTMLNALNS